MIRNAFTKWPWATTLAVALPIYAVVLMGVIGGSTWDYPPAWLTILAALTPAVGTSNIVVTLIRPAQPERPGEPPLA